MLGLWRCAAAPAAPAALPRRHCQRRRVAAAAVAVAVAAAPGMLCIGGLHAPPDLRDWAHRVDSAVTSAVTSAAATPEAGAPHSSGAEAEADAACLHRVARYLEDFGPPRSGACLPA
jgi:peptidoglycan/LPS O-acetylase OafA/YrhL